jgi:threonine/homoserine/homoserine lactone efflux protein
MSLIFGAIWKGLVLGMVLCISIGPAFFALIQTSIKNGFKSGIAFALGIFFSDLACVALSFLGILQLFQNPANKTPIGLIGGTILLVLGFLNLVSKKNVQQKYDNDKNGVIDQFEKENIAADTTEKPFTIPLIKGFLLNLFNPAVILIWAGCVGSVSAIKEYETIHLITFFIATLTTVLATDILKALSAHKIKRFLNDEILLWVNRIVGVIMICCGVVMIYKVF